MFARVSIIQVKSDKIDEAIKIYAESVTPARKAQKGSRGAYLFTARTPGKGLAITLWDSKQDILDDEESGRQEERIGNFKAFLAGPFTREIYEVSAQS